MGLNFSTARGGVVALGVWAAWVASLPSVCAAQIGPATATTGAAVAAPAPATTPAWQTSKLDNGTRNVSYRASASLLGKPTPFKVNFFCSPDSTKTIKGMLGIEVFVDDVASLGSFNFADFEGPDAVANGKKLLRIELQRPGKPLYVVNTTLNGWFTGPNTFAFGIADESQRTRSTAKTVLRSLAKDAEHLHLTITDPKNRKIKLEFSVPIAEKRGEFIALLTGLK